MKHLVISHELHKRIRLRAIHTGLTVKEVTETLLNDALKHG